MTQELWSYTAGIVPHKVTVYERENRGMKLYLRWRGRSEDGGTNWKYLALHRVLRTRAGKIVKDTERWAVAQAEAQYAKLVMGLAPEERAVAQPLTIRQGLERATNPASGKYQKPTPHRAEVTRELNRAAVILKDCAWTAIGLEEFTTLWRARIADLQRRGYDGLRGAEVTLARVLAVAQWLKDARAIPLTACVPPSDWKERIKAEFDEVPEPHRPRFTREQFLALLKHAPAVDPRFGFLLALGAEQRGGQIGRAMRSQLDVAAGALRIPGRGRKSGPTLLLTEGQMQTVRAVLATGYLRDLERTMADFPLFPAGQWPRRERIGWVANARMAESGAVGRTAFRDWLRATEALAGIAHVSGRGLYGLRRYAVDAANDEGISREGLQEHGGWADTQVPDRIYRDQERVKAREEARAVRARIRGEGA